MTLITGTDPLLQPLDYNSLTTNEQTYVDALIKVTTEQVEQYCNRIFLKATYTDEKSDGTGEASIFVKNIPLVSLTDVTVTYTGATGSTTETFDNDDLDLDLEIGEIKFKPNTAFLQWGSDIFPQGFQNIETTYVGGYTTVPESIQFVCAQAVLEIYDPTLVSGYLEKEKIGDYFYARSKNAVNNFIMSRKKILDRYRLRHVRKWSNV